MMIAKVIGEMVAEIKHDAIARRRLLVVQPLTPEGKDSGKTEIALDSVDAGVGDRVLVNLEGRSAADILGREGVPVRSIIVAVIDEVEIGGDIAYRKGGN